MSPVIKICAACICRALKHDIGIFDVEIVEPHAVVRVQSLADSESDSQSDDSFSKTADGGSSII
jgi:hypothetical protein